MTLCFMAALLILGSKSVVVLVTNSRLADTRIIDRTALRVEGLTMPGHAATEDPLSRGSFDARKRDRSMDSPGFRRAAGAWLGLEWRTDWRTAPPDDF
jgi:hypothetical protein